MAGLVSPSILFTSPLTKFGTTAGSPRFDVPFPPMPPRTTGREAPESHPHPDLGGDAPRSAHGLFVTHTPAGSVGAPGGQPDGFQSGAEHSDNMNFATDTPSVNNEMYRSESGELRSALGVVPGLPSVPFRDSSAHYPVLPPISSIYTNPASVIHNPSPLTAHPGALQGQLSIPILGPSTWGVPPVNTFQRPAIANHARTPSAGSSYYSTSMPSYGPPALASSVASAPSTGSVSTPHTMGSTYGGPWQPARPTPVFSGHPAPAAGGNAKPSFAKPARFTPI
ncbi:hypothetical protein FRC10_005884, partial [Ceratobasidium sp. 414]